MNFTTEKKRIKKKYFWLFCCRKSDSYVLHAYHLLMVQLCKDHAEIRRSAFQIIDQLFQRSHCFREKLVSEFQTFFELTIGKLERISSFSDKSFNHSEFHYIHIYWKIYIYFLNSSLLLNKRIGVMSGWIHAKKYLLLLFFISPSKSLNFNFQLKFHI